MYKEWLNLFFHTIRAYHFIQFKYLFMECLQIYTESRRKIQQQEGVNMRMMIDGTEVSAVWEENESVKALEEM